MSETPDLWTNGLRGRIDAIKTEFVAFLVVGVILVANKPMDLGLSFDEIMVYAGFGGLYAAARSVAKLRGG